MPYKDFPWFKDAPVGKILNVEEQHPTTYCNPIRRIKVGSSCLHPANTEDKILHSGTGAEMPPREIGELWVRGPQVMRGYFRDRESTAATLADGWLRRLLKDGHTAG